MKTFNFVCALLIGFMVVMIAACNQSTKHSAPVSSWKTNNLQYVYIDGHKYINAYRRLAHAGISNFPEDTTGCRKCSEAVKGFITSNDENIIFDLAK